MIGIASKVLGFPVQDSMFGAVRIADNEQLAAIGDEIAERQPESSGWYSTIARCCKARSPQVIAGNGLSVAQASSDDLERRRLLPDRNTAGRLARLDQIWVSRYVWRELIAHACKGAPK